MENQQEQEKEQEKPVEINLPTVINLPVINPDKFAELNGISPGIVSAWVERAYLPTVKIGRYKMINLAALYETLKKRSQAIKPPKVEATTNPAAAPITPLQKRILEIIRLDLDGLLKHAKDKAYTRHNTDLMLGFIAGSNLAYADQHCSGFTDLLTHLQQIIVWQLRGQAPCTPAHNAVLKELAEATNRALSQQIAKEVEQEAFGHSDNRHGEART